ncbi:glycosyltransferase family 2 protein, partial [Acidianus sp. RZ1]|uniref:glycosyltransferase family 2 protein n=1 Tax=Acidianus sp. RZ1 TaxID=1540082 RepID=UPI0014912CB7
MPLLSIIVVNVKGREHLSNLIKSLENSSFKDFELIIVDIKENKLRTQLEVKEVLIEEDKGLAFCRNKGLLASNSNLVLFLDNDTEVLKDTLLKFVNFLKENRKTIVQLKLVKEDGTIDAAGGVIDVLGYSHEIFRGTPKDDVKETYPVLYAKGAAFGGWREDLLYLGGFDDEYFYGYDETDLCI